MKEQNKARSLEDGEPGGARVGTQAMDALPPVTGGQTWLLTRIDLDSALEKFGNVAHG